MRHISAAYIGAWNNSREDRIDSDTPEGIRILEVNDSGGAPETTHLNNSFGKRALEEEDADLFERGLRENLREQTREEQRRVAAIDRRGRNKTVPSD